MAWEENPRICLHMQLIAILSWIGVKLYITFKKPAVVAERQSLYLRLTFPDYGTARKILGGMPWNTSRLYCQGLFFVCRADNGWLLFVGRHRYYPKVYDVGRLVEWAILLEETGMMELTLFHTLEWWQQAFRNSVKDVIQDSKTIGCKTK